MSESATKSTKQGTYEKYAPKEKAETSCYAWYHSHNKASPCLAKLCSNHEILNTEINFTNFECSWNFCASKIWSYTVWTHYRRETQGSVNHSVFIISTLLQAEHPNKSKIDQNIKSNTSQISGMHLYIQNMTGCTFHIYQTPIPVVPGPVQTPTDTVYSQCDISENNLELLIRDLESH